MGRKSGISCGGYHPKIWKMQWVMEQRAALRELEAINVEKMMTKKKMRFAYWTQREANAMNCLKANDQGWERWFDNDENVPAYGSIRERVGIIEARVVELLGYFPKFKVCTRGGVFVWRDEIGVYLYSKEVGKDALYMIEFYSLEAAEMFLAGLPNKNKGYGCVVDILPTPLSASTPTSPQIGKHDLEGVVQQVGAK